MCGLIGIIGDQPTTKHTREAVLGTALHLSSLRGDHSVGVFGLNNQDQLFWEKLEGGPETFMLYSGERALNNITDHLLMCHTRHATVGTINSANAHPFAFPLEDATTAPTFIGAHNGTLTNKNELAKIVGKDTAQYGTDSEALMHALYEYGPQDVLPEVRGAYALTWYNQETRRAYIARNAQRPLWFAFSKNMNNRMVYASERGMVILLAERHNLNIDEDTIQQLPTNEIWSFAVGRGQPRNLLESKEVVEYTPKHGGTYGNYSTRRVGFQGNTDWEEDDYDAYLYGANGYANAARANTQAAKKVEKKTGTSFEGASLRNILPTKGGRSFRVTETKQPDNKTEMVCGEHKAAGYTVVVHGAPKGQPSVYERRCMGCDCGIVFDPNGDHEPKEEGPKTVEELFPDRDEEPVLELLIPHPWDGKFVRRSELEKQLNDGCAYCGNPIDPCEDYRFEIEEKATCETCREDYGSIWGEKFWEHPDFDPDSVTTDEDNEVQQQFSLLK